MITAQNTNNNKINTLSLSPIVNDNIKLNNMETKNVNIRVPAIAHTSLNILQPNINYSQSNNHIQLNNSTSKTQHISLRIETSNTQSSIIPWVPLVSQNKAIKTEDIIKPIIPHNNIPKLENISLTQDTSQNPLTTINNMQVNAIVPNIQIASQNNISSIPIVPNIKFRPKGTKLSVVPIAKTKQVFYNYKGAKIYTPPDQFNVNQKNMTNKIIIPPVMNKPIIPNINFQNNKYINFQDNKYIKVNVDDRSSISKSLFADFNPYIGLPQAIINKIAEERDIQLTGSLSNRADQLHQFDKIMPEWVQSISTKDFDNVNILTGTKLYIFASLNNINVHAILNNNLKGKDLINYIKISLLFNNTNNQKEKLTKLINSVDRNILNIISCKLQIPKNYFKFITTEQLRIAILNENINHININNISLFDERYNILTTHKYSNLLNDLYKVGRDDNIWIKCSQNKPHPMESTILNIDKISIQDIINCYGIIVPLQFSNDTKSYVLENIVSYASVVTRKITEFIPLEVLVFSIYRKNTDDINKYLSQLKDTEIFANIGVYVPYTSRNELIINIINCINNHTFMSPTIRQINRCHNTMTITGTEITDTSIFMICYGIATKYQMYELGELINSFHRDESTGCINFRRPDMMHTNFDRNDIESLIRLLQSFPITDEITQLLNIINEGLIEEREKIAFDSVARKQLSYLDQKSKQLIKKYLYQIFYIGMYLRQWQGPGTPFPLKEQTTRQTYLPHIYNDKTLAEQYIELKNSGFQISILDAKSSREIGVGLEILKSMNEKARNFCFNLKVCQYNKKGTIDTGTLTFKTEWDGVVKGTQCIRMASSEFIGTGYHYLRVLYQETIPGIDVCSIDRVA